MCKSTRNVLLAIVLVVAGSHSPSIGQTGEPRPFEDARSARSIEIVRYSCRNELGVREVTLFANGTLRLRDGLAQEVGMWLEELRPEERDGFVARLLEEDWSETDRRYRSVEGEWVETCRLRLELPGQPLRAFDFGRYDSLSLSLQRAVSIAEELIARVDQSRRPTGASEIPSSYEPRVGDTLRNESGHRYRLVAFTSDGKGAELQGLDQPLTIYLALTELRHEFVDVEQRPQR